MNALKWILIIELVLLVAALLFTGVGMFIARTDPDDPIVIFCRTFWHEFLHPPFEAARAGKGSRGRASASPAPAAIEARAPARKGSRAAEKDEEAMYGRAPKAADGVVHTANLNVVVLPHSESDEVLGRTSDGIELMVTSAAEDGASNKTVIQLVSKALGVKPYQVTLTKGHYATRKAVAITGMDQDQLEAKLESLG